ncbi:type II toxin-antitoxin system VapC family toxin [Enorma phocaeensis]|uniref:type II toxin-antitoxin system VapC family toxin n=1 Tax=Enorma phocaeensis TaxID=1871019 RepID=UPI0019575AFC|nr:type II toxin-antitoxin system VapC family toxin [Enorma phocaeensis]MBM6952908.1 type II toxin-antitoxin system VapC family toxin [Enorma phocaeensis]
MSEAISMLLDTNVWIDLFDGNRPMHLRAQALLSKAIEHDAEVFFYVTSVKDLYYTLSRNLKQQARRDHGAVLPEDALSSETIAWACVQSVQELAAPVGIDFSDVWLAGMYRELHRDFEDSLIAAAATRCKADVLVTNDECFLRHCPVRAMDSADALTWLTLQAR